MPGKENKKSALQRTLAACLKGKESSQCFRVFFEVTWDFFEF